MNFLRKSLILLLISIVIFSSGVPAIYAEMIGLDPISSEVTDKAMGDIMDYFGIDQEATKGLVQTMNVSRQKKNPPQVSITFTPASPTAGSEITASAIPTYFMGDPSVLYYTWYLKHNTATAESTDSEGRMTLDGNTDWNEDGAIDIEDYKIEAMRLIANGGFDWQQAVDENQYATATPDDDGYSAIFGGEEQAGKTAHCYVHDIKSGEEYEISCEKHLFPNAPSEETGDGQFSTTEESFWHTDPTATDTSNSGTTDEASVAGLGKETITWNYMTGDKIGVAVEGASIESTDYADSSYKIMWAVSGSPETATETTTESSSSREDAGSLVYRFEHLGDYYCGYTNQGTTEVDFHNNDDADDDTVIEPRATVVDANAKCTVTLSCADEPITLTHPGLADGRTDSSDNYVSGDLNTPYSYFRWKSFGDRGLLMIVIDKAYPDDCTVSVDGESGNFMERIGSDDTETTTTSSIDDINDSLEDGLIEPSEGNGDTKLEVALSYSPSSPTNSASGDQLIVQSSIIGAENKDFLNYDWEISISSDMAAEDSAWYLLTQTELEEQTGLNKLSGIGLGSLEMQLNFTDTFLEPIIGADQKTFYAKFVLRAIEDTKEGVATVIVPIQSSTATNAIKIFSTTVAADFSVSLNDTATDVERCSDVTICPVVKDEIIGVKFPTDTPTDYDFLWSLDNEPVSETAQNIAYFPILAEKGTQQILTLTASNKTTGEKIILTKTFEVADPTITLESMDTETCAPTLLGYYVDPINANTVTEGINAGMETTTGTTDTTTWPDLSTDKFEALFEESVTIKPTINTEIPEGNKAWFFDGVQVTTDNMTELGIAAIDATTDAISFTVNKAVGEKYTLTYGALYTPSDLVKNALYATWAVPQTSFYEKTVSQTIEIEVTDYLSSTKIAQTKNTQQKVLASLFSAIPSYINFLFRVTLTIFLILFLMRTLFAIFPEQTRI